MLSSGESNPGPRAQLALAIASQENPLLWRSMANRVWLWLMGRGIVGTPNDFGHMGDPPTHPELLDYLACQLRDDANQSLKKLIRLIVTSEAYQRSSQIVAESKAKDSENKLHWRTLRRQLTPQEIRDAQLFVGGAFKEDKGGHGFKDFVIDKPQHSPHYEYEAFDPNQESSHRRTIYRFVVRSQPQPFLTTLGCADPSLSVPVRDEPTTALQALALWNNPFVAAMCTRFKNRLTEDRSLPEAEQLNTACQLIWGRTPTTTERDILNQHLSAHGWESLARVLFNSHAFIYLE